MTHITLTKKSNSNPCLEFYSDGGGEPRRVALEKFPFRIGRAESANLRVDSVEVSREHAEILERNGVCLVRDLGSTNGTQINGKPIKETLLSDGDILKVAETELTFIASPASQFQRMVTQPIQAKKAAAVPCTLPPEIRSMRMIVEATLWQAIPSQLIAATSMKLGVTEAYFAPQCNGPRHQPLLDQSGAVASHYRELAHLEAVESAIERAEASRLFLAISAADIEAPQPVFERFDRVRDLLPDDWELGVTISLPTDVDILRINQVYRQLRERELLVTFDRFQGNGGQVMHLKSLLPDYLVVAENMTKDLETTRQPLRRLESLVAACEDLGIKPVLPRDDAGHGLALCREIGFDLALHLAAHSGAPATDSVCMTV